MVPAKTTEGAALSPANHCPGGTVTPKALASACPPPSRAGAPLAEVGTVRRAREGTLKCQKPAKDGATPSPAYEGIESGVVRRCLRRDGDAGTTSVVALKCAPFRLLTQLFAIRDADGRCQMSWTNNIMMDLFCFLFGGLSLALPLKIQLASVLTYLQYFSAAFLRAYCTVL